MENNVDITPEMGYNGSNDDVNEHIVKMDEQAPLHDIECKHETLIPNPEDTIGSAIYHDCANRNCIVGFYIQK